MRHETCLTCINPPPGDEEFLIPLKLAEMIGDHAHHHHRINCINCGAWWFDDVKLAASHVLVVDTRDTSWCDCPEDAEYYRHGTFMVFVPESECRCTGEFVDRQPKLEMNLGSYTHTKQRMDQQMSGRSRLLDLFCGAGGAAMGYYRAGFDVTGVDISPQPRYPFTFVQADAMTYPLDGFDAIHASPPCQDHSSLSALHAKHGTGWMLAGTRDRLSTQSRPWVIENVPGAPLRADYRLCGCMFGLDDLRRDRWFETSWRGFDLRSPCVHTGQTITVAGHGADGRYYRNGGTVPTVEDWRRVMGIDWMTQAELAQAIPPAYTEHIGARLLDYLGLDQSSTGSTGTVSKANDQELL
jgi:DNA (cytosine-5)-methyltransferase 1